MSLDATDTNLNLQFDNQTLTAPSTGLDHLTSSLNNKGEWNGLFLQCPKLKTLRLEENCLTIDSIPTTLLADR